MNGLPPGMAVTSAVRDGLRIIMEGGAPCPTCGQGTGPRMHLREVTAETAVSAATLSRFLRGAPITSDVLDRLYEWVNARLPEPPTPEPGA